MQFDDTIPIYLQIKQYLEREIILGHWAPGTKVPAVRQLAVELTVNVNTVQRALGELIDSGILVPQRGRGNFVTEDPAAITQLTQELVDSHFARLYAQLSELQIAPDTMPAYFADYIEHRKKADAND